MVAAGNWPKTAPRNEYAPWGKAERMTGVAVCRLNIHHTPAVGACYFPGFALPGSDAWPQPRVHRGGQSEQQLGAGPLLRPAKAARRAGGRSPARARRLSALAIRATGRPPMEADAAPGPLRLGYGALLPRRMECGGIRA